MDDEAAYPRSRRLVKFASSPSVAFVESTSNRSITKPKVMAPQIFETFSRDEVTNDMVAQAAKLFSENYGVWGEQSAQPGREAPFSIV